MTKNDVAFKKWCHREESAMALMLRGKINGDIYIQVLNEYKQEWNHCILGTNYYWSYSYSYWSGRGWQNGFGRWK